MEAMKTEASPTTPTDAYDVERVRADFPILGRPMNGKRLAYLDSAASSQKPRPVIEAEAHYYEQTHANIHRGVYALSQRATEAFEHAREVVRRFLNASDARQIVFVRGTTEAINLVARSYGRGHVGPGDVVLVSEMEHHSNIVPWQLLCQDVGARVVPIPITDDGALDLDAYGSLLDDRVKLVAIAHVSNAIGTVNPLPVIIERAHAAGVPVVVDGAQGVVHATVDVQALDADFYAFSSHKIYGPTGVGVLYGKRELLEAMPPYQGGGDMIRSVSFTGTTYNDVPYRFEAGTPNIAGAIGLAAALEYVESLGPARIHRHIDALLGELVEALSAIEGLRFVGTAPERAGLVSFVLDGVHPHDVGTILDGEGVAVRTGHHCAQPLMERFGVPATTRASLACYSSGEDIEALVRALHTVREVFGS
jgi:cysteine desulfurase/selenocysteine lyase